MSMPQYLIVAVICGELSFKKDAQNFGGEKASAVAAILTGQYSENELAPYFLPVAFSECRLSLTQYAISKGFVFSHRPLYPRLINPKEINMWLALDKEGFQEAQKRIKEGGSSTNEFYREVFPETVMRCGFSVPEPSLESDYQAWFDLLTEKLTPWKQRIWNAFYESS